ncbi:hypothetical protein QFZ97_006911 [Paraburkholderia youngii]
MQRPFAISAPKYPSNIFPAHVTQKMHAVRRTISGIDYSPPLGFPLVRLVTAQCGQSTPYPQEGPEYTRPFSEATTCALAFGAFSAVRRTDNTCKPRHPSGTINSDLMRVIPPLKLACPDLVGPHGSKFRYGSVYPSHTVRIDYSEDRAPNFSIKILRPPSRGYEVWDSALPQVIERDRTTRQSAIQRMSSGLETH